MVTTRLSALVLIPASLLLAACSRTVTDTDMGGGAGGVSPCAPGEKSCANGCVPEAPENGCASESCEPCYAPHAIAGCGAGVCKIDACDLGWAMCDGAKVCSTHTDADAANCGACGVVCSFPHAAAACFGGSCAMLACDPGWGSCVDSPGDGCETNIDADPKNCGACSVICGPLQMCKQGKCITGS